MGWQKLFMVQRRGEGRPLGSGFNCEYQSLNYQNSRIRLLNDMKLDNRLHMAHSLYLRACHKFNPSPYVLFVRLSHTRARFVCLCFGDVTAGWKVLTEKFSRHSFVLTLL